MTPESARHRLFSYVVNRLGRPEAAKRLKTDVFALNAWMSGTDEPPTDAVMALADLVYQLKKAEIEK